MSTTPTVPDNHPSEMALPDGLELAHTTPTFDEHTAPSSLVFSSGDWAPMLGR